MDGDGLSGVLAAPLTAALYEWVARATPSWDVRRRVAVMRRLGWIGAEIPTLEEAGIELGITRERVRQLVTKLLRAIARYKPPAEVSGPPVEVIASARQARILSPGEALAAAGLTTAPMPEHGVDVLFALLDRGDVLLAYRDQAAGHLDHRKAVVHVAKALSGSIGMACVEWVSEPTGVSGKDVRERLSREPWCEFLDETWFWNPRLRPGRNRAENATITMLAGCGPLTVQDLREGLDRLHRFRPGHMRHVPSLAALRLFYAAHPRFTIGPDDVVSSRERLDPNELLDRTELTLIKIFNEAPLGVLDRTELMRRGVAAGLNRNSLAVATSYSLVVDSPAQDRWALRGRRVSPAALESAGRPRQTRFRDEEWQANGSLRVRREVGTSWSMVVSLPSAYDRLFGGRIFEATGDVGEDVGQIRFNETGTSWGYSPFLQGRDATEGDVLIADFDLASTTCRLSLAARATAEMDPGP